jgi:hypothetical protein
MTSSPQSGFDQSRFDHFALRWVPTDVHPASGFGVKQAQCTSVLKAIELKAFGTRKGVYNVCIGCICRVSGVRVECLGFGICGLGFAILELRVWSGFSETDFQI